MLSKGAPGVFIEENAIEIIVCMLTGILRQTEREMLMW